MSRNAARPSSRQSAAGETSRGSAAEDSSRRRAAERAGRRAEQLAAWWLRLHGWRILAARTRIVGIEVDLVARRGGIIALVEVKRRATLAAAVAALTPDAAARLQRAARQLASERLARGAAVTVRVDLVALAPGRLPLHIGGVG